MMDFHLAYTQCRASSSALTMIVYQETGIIKKMQGRRLPQSSLDEPK